MTPLHEVPPAPHAGQSLRARFVARLLMAALAAAIVVSVFGYGAASRRSVAESEATLQALAQTVEKTVAIGAYANDNVLLHEVVLGLQRHPLVGRAMVLNAHGKPMIDMQGKDDARKPGPAADTDDAAAAAGAGLRVELPLSSPFDAAERVGKLVVIGDAERISELARELAVGLVAALVSLVAVLALMSQWLTDRLLTRPLQHTAEQLASMEPGSTRQIDLPEAHRNDELGTVVEAANRLLAANADVLARERTVRAEIAAMEQQYRQIFDFSSAGIFVLTTQGRLVNSNPTVARIIGASVEQMSHLRGTDFVNLVFQDAGRVRQMIVGAAQNGQTASADLELRRLDGSSRWVHCLISVQGEVPNAPGQPSRERLLEGVIYDVTQRKRDESANSWRAEHDPLTGLKNRATFEAAVQAAIDRAELAGDSVTVMYIDLDGFKQVNDQLGHAAGDAVLIECATRLRALSRRATDIVARLGGDELAVLLDGVDGSEGVVRDMASRIVETLSLPYMLAKGREARIGASVGFASYPRHGTVARRLIRSADAAMYQVKRNGRNGWAQAEEAALTDF